MGSKTTNPSPVAPRDRRIVLLGKTGAGKSSSGNTIFGGKKVFDISSSSVSKTDQCQSEFMIIDGRKITLIDTPGFFDTRISKNDEIINFLAESAEGIHAFLIVFPVRRFTEQEKEVFMEIQNDFSEEVFKYATVLFTHGDDLEGRKIQDFVKESDKLQEMVQKCGDRCHVIDNKHWNENGKNKVQVTELLNTIDQAVENNGGNCYNNELLKAVHEEIEEEKMSIRKLGSNLSEEINKQARKRVKNRSKVILAGVATGALLGAVFGIAAGVAATVAALSVGGAAAAGGYAASLLAEGPVLGAGAVVEEVTGGVIGYEAVDEQKQQERQ